jgi:ankyrin repeat protein
MTCSRTGDAASVKSLIAHGASVNAPEPLHHQTALMWAAAEKHPEVIKALLDAGADVQARSRVYTQTVSSDLRTNRADLAFTVRRGGSTALLFAARSGDLESARLLIGAKADVNDKAPDGTSALAEAAYSGNIAVALCLLEKGADANAAESGYAPLHAAVLKSEVELVKALLAHGATPNAEITKGTPLRRATSDFNLPATLIGATPYLLAAKFLEPEIMRALLDAGADPSLPMKDGTTPLMAAAGIGARANQNRRGRTVTDGAKLEYESLVVATVSVALSRPVAVNAVNGAGDTALHGAATMGYDRVVQILGDHGADVNIKNKRGQTPLALASAPPATFEAGAQAPHRTTMELLRKLGAKN